MLIDHFVVLLFAIVYPVSGYFGYRKILRRHALGLPINRPLLYRNTILSQVTLLVIALSIWFSEERAAADIGLVIHWDAYLAVGVVITVVLIGGLLAQLRQVRRTDQATINEAFQHLGSVAPLIPASPLELRQFDRVGLTAGIVEEVLWRGYLMWYLGMFLETWVAGVVVTLAFGLAHAYQGLNKVPQIVLVGAAFLCLYLLTGSLLLSMVLHIAVDWIQGRVAYEIVTRRGV